MLKLIFLKKSLNMLTLNSLMIKLLPLNYDDCTSLYERYLHFYCLWPSFIELYEFLVDEIGNQSQNINYDYLDHRLIDRGYLDQSNPFIQALFFIIVARAFWSCRYLRHRSLILLGQIEKRGPARRLLKHRSEKIHLHKARWPLREIPVCK